MCCSVLLVSTMTTIMSTSMSLKASVRRHAVMTN
jgi:hypothetical protein